MRNIVFGVGEYYHIYARGVDKREVFSDDIDRRRFITAMLKSNMIDAGSFVSIVCFVMMPNHYHFLVRQEIEKGVSRFMQRFSNGYTKYFNCRHDRSGRLFSSPYQAKYVNSDSYLKHLTRYIHRNPIKLQVVLADYPWSSYRHFIGLERQTFVDASTIMTSKVSDYRKYVEDDDRAFDLPPADLLFEE